MKVKLALGVAVLAACSEGSGQSPGQRQAQARAERARVQADEGSGDVAGGETSEFSGDISACPEIASSEPLDLDDPEIASWVAMAQGHHEQTLGWRRLVLSDEVAGFAEHTSVSIDVNVLGGRDIVYGGGGNTDYELSGCDGLRARQIELEITLATADGAVAATFRNWFSPGPTASGGMVLDHHGLNPDGSGPFELNGTLDLGLAPALAGTSQVGYDIEFGADSVHGTLSPAVMPDNDAGKSGWWPIEAVFPDDPCGSQGSSIGLDEFFGPLGATPRARYQLMARARGRDVLPAIWKSSLYGDEPSALDVPPPTVVSLDAGEPTRACDFGGSVTVYAPLTVTTADGLVNLTQPFAFNLSDFNYYISEQTSWVPATDFDEQMGIGGLNLESGYGSIYLQNEVDQNSRIEGALEVQQWDAFTHQAAPYPALVWCKGRASCFSETE